MATYQRVKTMFYWPSMIKNVKLIVQECEECQRCKNEYVDYLGLLQPLLVPEKAWEHISMDSLRTYQNLKVRTLF